MHIDLKLTTTAKEIEDLSDMSVVELPKVGETILHPDDSKRRFLVKEITHAPGANAKIHVLAEEIPGPPEDKDYTILILHQPRR